MFAFFLFLKKRNVCREGIREKMNYTAINCHIPERINCQKAEAFDIHIPENLMLLAIAYKCQ